MDKRSFIYEAVEDIKTGEKVVVTPADDSARVHRPAPALPDVIWLDRAGIVHSRELDLAPCTGYIRADKADRILLDRNDQLRADLVESNTRARRLQERLDICENSRDDADRLLRKSLRDQKQMEDNLTSTQARCTELLEENRRLRTGQ